MSKTGTKEIVSNRRAFHDYEILETFEAGIVLTGTEIKSLRAGGGSLQESYIRVIKDELWLIGAHIAPYAFGNVHNHEERRERKLLMHKKEIEKLYMTAKTKGVTLVPLSLYFSKGRVKLKLCTGKGKKVHDKRQAIREKEEKRASERALKQKC
jgi:SsrA-binding protein